MQKPVQTFINSGKNYVTDDDDVIHCEIELQQHSQYGSR